MPTAQPSGQRSLIVATAGHVDHGKSSLIKHITGTDTDTLEEEKARGLSINIGFAYHKFVDASAGVNGTGEQCILGFVDVPGHIDFINNMLAGVSAVEAALLVVAADDGIMPQTREHLAILDLLQVKQGVVAITKCDKVDPARSQQVEQEVKSLLANTGLSDARILPVSNVTKQGIDEILNALQALLREKTKRNSSAKNADGGFRYLIDRRFTVKGLGTVVTGTVVAGQLQTGASIFHSASAQTTRVKGIRLDDENRQQAVTGQRVALNIDLGYQKISRGDWLMDAGLYQPVTRFDARVRLLPGSANRIKAAAQYHLYTGASHHIVNLRQLEINPPLSANLANSELDNLYQIKCNDNMIVHFGDLFVLRDPSSQTTIGGGHVLDIYVPRRQRSSQARLLELNAQDADHLSALRNLLALSQAGVSAKKFMTGRNCSPALFDELRAQLADEGNEPIALPLSDDKAALLLQQQFYQNYCLQIKQQLSQHHAKHSNEQGMSEPLLSRTLEFKGSHFLLHSLIESLLRSGEIKRTGTLIHLPGHKASASEEETAFMEQIEPLLRTAGRVPPRTRELVELTGIPLKALDKILKSMARTGQLIKVAENRYYLPETIMELADFAEKLVQAHPEEGFSVIQFRDSSGGIGRNLCIELLEYFDKAGYTRRDGNSRFIRTDKDNIFN